MGCGVYYQQLNEVERALRSLRRLGIDEFSPAYRQLFSLRGQLLSNIGFKFPRTASKLFKLAGLSPGEITLWHDVESGWFTEAREYAGAAPVYHFVGDDIAGKILKSELTHDEFEELKVPDVYIDY